MSSAAGRTGRGWRKTGRDARKIVAQDVAGAPLGFISVAPAASGRAGLGEAGSGPCNSSLRGRSWPNSGRSLRRTRPHFCERPTLSQSFGRHWPNWSNWASGENSTEFGQQSSNVGGAFPSPLCVDRCRPKIGPSLAEFGKSCSGNGQIWLDIEQIWVDVGPARA